MTMAACYTSYDIPSISHGIEGPSTSSQQPQQQMTQILHQGRQHHVQQQPSRLSSVAAATALVTVTAAAAASSLTAAANSNLSTQKDYSIPLHVDCSVEYELPNQPKPPAGQRVEPLLMIHPCYFRKMESQRRSPFINNMPNTSRNSNTILSVVSSAAQSSNIASSTAIVSSSRRSLTRHQQQSQVLHQPHNHHRQTASTQYNSIHPQSHQQQQQIRPLQNNPQQQMSQMSQQAHYPVVSLPSVISTASGQYIEHATAIRRAAAAAAASVHRSHMHSRSVTSLQQQKHSQQHLSQNHQQTLLVQNASSTAATHWDQLAAVATIVTSIAPHSNSVLPPAPNMPSHNLCVAPPRCSTINASVGKRDAMISGGYATNSSNTTTRSQANRLNNGISSSCKNNNGNNSSNSHGASTSLVDTTNLRWNTATNRMIDRSPIATVPSNYQAGPDTTPTPLHNTIKTNNDNNNAIIKSNNNVSSSGKYRQYLRSQRVHPYLAAISKTAVSSATPSVINHIGQPFPQFSAATAAVATVAATPSFQQHLQQISCYNV